MSDEQRSAYFQILVDAAGRYGLWPLHEAVPERWSPVGFVSTRQECLRQLALLWDDRGPVGPRSAEPGGPSAPITGIVRAARRHATAVAVDDSHERLDYRELMARATRLARTLVSLGIDPGDRVALCLPSWGAALVALLGTSLAGAVFLPVDVDTPVEQRDRLLTATGTRLLLAEKESGPGRSDIP
ncbi:MAG TPA: AMP-binding protein, partial [Thermobifida alba]|nr:AMP-binding protein [Thermobifida alba]